LSVFRLAVTGKLSTTMKMLAPVFAMIFAAGMALHPAPTKAAGCIHSAEYCACIKAYFNSPDYRRDRVISSGRRRVVEQGQPVDQATLSRLRMHVQKMQRACSRYPHV